MPRKTAPTASAPAPIGKAGFNLDRALIRRFRIAALEQDRTMTEIVDELIRDWLGRHERERRAGAPPRSR